MSSTDWNAAAARLEREAARYDREAARSKGVWREIAESQADDHRAWAAHYRAKAKRQR
ncbi:hypothetical protein ACFVT1_03065 [Streptomyces sp. NPDC057963]|uniref:hypothetical protein n=1 Tax=Streptomyces sp. NPDC057963 TaxID=3346290 RepID=UPI0036E23B53